MDSARHSISSVSRDSICSTAFLFLSSSTGSAASFSMNGFNLFAWVFSSSCFETDSERSITICVSS